jgi:beta propeller repeat protein
VRPPRRPVRVWFLIASAATVLVAAGETRADSPKLIVKLRAEGTTAVSECAQAISEQGRSFQSASADGSDSLDRMHQQLGVRRVRALYRRPDGRPFAQQRAHLKKRLEAKKARRPRGREGKSRTATLPDLSHVYVLDLPEDSDPGEAAARYRNDPHVEWAQADVAIEANFVPDDPFFSSSGSWGQSYEDLWGLHRIGASEAWDISQGDGVVVAVVDTGLDYEHPDMAANVWVNPGEDLNGNGIVDDSDFNGLDDDDNGFVDDIRGFDWQPSFDVEEETDPDPFDDNGHGSHVTGTIAAVGNNGIGIVGVAPGARVLPLKVLNEFGSGSISKASLAIVYAAENGARVINNSWSCGGGCPSNPVVEEAVRTAHALGAVVVFSAGNRSGDIAWLSPQNMRETITVAATSERDRVLDSSNPGFLLDVAAPGGGSNSGSVPLSHQNVLSLRASARVGGDGQTVADDYFRLSGTSMSAPHVSGLAALLLAHRSDRTPEQVRAILRSSAVDLGVPGHDRDHGAGRIDAAGALAVEDPPDVRAEITAPAQRSVVRQQVGTLQVLGSVSGTDLASYELSVGRGLEPEAWTPLAAGDSPVLEGTLGAWPVEDLDNGTYVLRLAAVAHDGTRIEEFAVGSLERIPARRVSSLGRSAFDPDVSGNLVVWASRRTFAEDDAVNLFATDLRNDREHVISAATGDQLRPKVAGNVVVWRDLRNEDGASIYGCHLSGGGQHCSEVLISEPPVSASTADVSFGHVTWADDRSGIFDLFVCRLLGQRCHATPVAVHASNQVEVLVDGPRLVWRDDRLGTPRLFTCVRDLRSGECPAHEVSPDAGLQVSAAVSGNYVAWEEFVNGNRSDLAICDLGAGEGACDPLMVRTREAAPSPALSGNRLVWHSDLRGEDRDIFLCEFDARTRDCPVQQITGATGAQQDPAIDGDWVVWEDFRHGKSEIFGLELPRLSEIGDREVDEGRWLWVRVIGHDPQGGPLRLSAQLADAGELSELGARFHDTGKDRGFLFWKPDFDQAGEYWITFTGTSAAEVSTRKTIRVRVLDAEPRPRRGGD